MNMHTMRTRAGNTRGTSGEWGGKRANFAAVLAAHWVGVALLAASPALARQGAVVDEPLGGPKVVDRAPPGERAFGEQEMGKGPGGAGKFARRGAPHAAFMRAVRGLGGNLGVSEEQREEIMAIEQEFRSAMKAFRDEHQEEIAAIRAKAGMGEGMRGGSRPGPDGERRGRGERAGKGAADLTPEQQEARTKLKALMEKAPKPDEYQTRQWAVLSAEQQNAVKAAMEEMRDAGPRERTRRGGPGAEGRPEGAPPRAGRGERQRGPGFGPPGFGPGGRGPDGEARGERMHRKGPPAHRGGPGRGPGPGTGPGPGPGPGPGAGGPEDPMMPPPLPPSEEDAMMDEEM